MTKEHSRNNSPIPLWNDEPQRALFHLQRGRALLCSIVSLKANSNTTLWFYGLSFTSMFIESVLIWIQRIQQSSSIRFYEPRQKLDFWWYSLWWFPLILICPSPPSLPNNRRQMMLWPRLHVPSIVGDAHISIEILLLMSSPSQVPVTWALNLDLKGAQTMSGTVSTKERVLFLIFALAIVIAMSAQCISSIVNNRLFGKWPVEVHVHLHRIILCRWPSVLEKINFKSSTRHSGSERPIENFLCARV